LGYPYPAAAVLVPLAVPVPGKLHLDTADCDIPISALLSSASLHDSLTEGNRKIQSSMTKHTEGRGVGMDSFLTQQA
jgi:hypothetical protein